MSVEVQFLSIREFAELIKVHPETVRRAIHRGHISAFRVGAGRSVYRIARTEINRVAAVDLEKVVEEIIMKRFKKKEKKVEGNDTNVSNNK